MKRFASAGLVVFGLCAGQLAVAGPLPPVSATKSIGTSSVGVSFGDEPVAPTEVVTDPRLGPGLRPGDRLTASEGSRELTTASEDCSSETEDRCERWISALEPALTPAGGEAAWASTISPDGSLSFVTGSSVLGIRTAAVRSADGSGVWESLWLGDPLGPGGTPRDIATSPDGSAVFVTGAIGTSRYPYMSDIATIAYNPVTGEELWAHIFDGPKGGPDLGYSVEVSPDGSIVLVAGQAAPITGTIYWQGEPVVLAYDAEDGDLLWSSVQLGTGLGYAIATTFIGNSAYVLGVGLKPGASQYDAWVTRYRAGDGAPVWSVWTGWARNETPWGIAADPDGDKLFINMVSDNTVAPWGADFLIVALDAGTGSELWRDRFRGQGEVDGVNIPTSIAVGPELEEGAPAGDVRVYIGGLVPGTQFGDHDYGIVAYDGETGARIWVWGYGSPRDERLWDMTLSPEGRHVYMTGRDGPPYTGGASGGTAVNAATIALDATSGNTTWIAKFAGAFGGSSGDPVGVDVTVDGSTVVTSTTLTYPTGTERAVDPADMVALGYDAL